MAKSTFYILYLWKKFLSRSWIQASSIRADCLYSNLNIPQVELVGLCQESRQPADCWGEDGCLVVRSIKLRWSPSSKLICAVGRCYIGGIQCGWNWKQHVNIVETTIQTTLTRHRCAYQLSLKLHFCTVDEIVDRFRFKWSNYEFVLRVAERCWRIQNVC